MTDAQYVALVEKLSKSSEGQPRFYRFRVLCMALAGYAYLACILNLILGLLALMVLIVLASGKLNFALIKFAVPLVLVFVTIVDAISVKLPPPQGTPLTARSAPELFQLLEKIRKKMKSTKCTHVLLVEDFNASIVQIPRLGIFGYPVNYLILGYPLMASLTAKQFQAVLAHEFGHLSRAHGVFGAWIYRLRETWQKLFDQLEKKKRWGAYLFSGFFTWFFPRFSAASFVLARAYEYEADQAAAALAGADDLADALKQIEIKSRYLEDSFWPKLFDGVKVSAAPPQDPFHLERTGLQQGVRKVDGIRWLGDALSRESGYQDPHPSLFERLKAVGKSLSRSQVALAASGEFIGTVKCGGSAADVYLPKEDTEAALSKWNLNWLQQWTKHWKEKHLEVRQARAQMEALKEKHASLELAEGEDLIYGQLVAELEGSEVALPIFGEIVNRAPDHQHANYAYGSALLSQGRDEGIKFIERAMAKDLQYILSGCELIYFHYSNRGKKAEADIYLERARKHQQVVDLATLEREKVEYHDRFEAHGLSGDVTKLFYDRLGKYNQLATAYLVKKSVRHLPEYPLYVIAVVAKKTKDPQVLANHVAEFAQQFGGVAVFVNDRKFVRKCDKVKGALIFKRGTNFGHLKNPLQFHYFPMNMLTSALFWVLCVLALLVWGIATLIEQAASSQKPDLFSIHASNLPTQHSTNRGGVDLGNEFRLRGLSSAETWQLYKEVSQ